MNEQRCETCHFWRNDECRSKSPIHTDEEWAVWPKTDAEDWCGEWRPKID